MFQSLFSRKSGELLGGNPRLKSYSARSGEVYRYFFQGHRRYRRGVEFVFQLAEGTEWRPIRAFLADVVVTGWQSINSRKLSSTEQYAIAKMALFEAFEKSPPSELQVTTADVTLFAERLGF